MYIKRIIKNLHRKGIISKAPHPLIPFLISALFLLFFIYKKYLYGEYLSNILIFLTIFSFIFGILHLIVVRILDK